MIGMLLGALGGLVVYANIFLGIFLYVKNKRVHYLILGFTGLLIQWSSSFLIQIYGRQLIRTNSLSIINTVALFLGGFAIAVFVYFIYTISKQTKS